MDDYLSMANYGRPYQAGMPNMQDIGNVNSFMSTSLPGINLDPSVSTLSKFGPMMNGYRAPEAVSGMGMKPAWKSSDFWFGGTDAKTGNQSGGAAMPLLMGGNALMQGFLGMKQYGLAKDTFNQGKREFEMNHANQVRLTNAQLEDRQIARVASNPGGYQSVSGYMDKNGVK